LGERGNAEETRIDRKTSYSHEDQMDLLKILKDYNNLLKWKDIFFKS
jgi:hypothetical protein